MANYDSADNKLKIAYPKIIVDIVSILAKGVDTSGKKYFFTQRRRSDLVL